MLDKLFGNENQDPEHVRLQRRQERVRERMAGQNISEDEATRLILAEERAASGSTQARSSESVERERLESRLALEDDRTDPGLTSVNRGEGLERIRPDPDRLHPAEIRVERTPESVPAQPTAPRVEAVPRRSTSLDADMPPAINRAPVPAPERAVVSERSTRLLDDARSREIAARWETIQARFVDQPRESVREADALVGAVLKELTDRFTAERRQMEQQWSRDDASTEDLRVALQHYRSVFQRLLSI